MNLNLAVISGDGIGPEVVREARKVLDRIAEKYGQIGRASCRERV